MGERRLRNKYAQVEVVMGYAGGRTMQEDYGSVHERRSYSKFSWEQLLYDRRYIHSKALWPFWAS